MNGEAIIEWAFVLVSLFGYVRLLIHHCGVKPAFAPLTVMSLQTLAVYIAGLTGIPGAMKVTVCVLQAGGAAAFIGCLLADRRRADALRNAALASFALLLVWIGYAIVGEKVRICDNFTHWIQIARVMLENGRLPISSDRVITFTSYPPGSACFIYYMCACLHYEEWYLIAAQAMLIAACVITVAGVLPRNALVYTAAVFVFSIACTVFTEQIYDLLVDGLLAALTCAGLFYVIHCLKTGKQPDFLCLGPILSVLVLTKNSGLFFAAFIVIFGIAAAKPRDGSRKRILLCALIPAALYAAWQLHVHLIFADASSGKHALSAKYYSMILKNKSPEDILATLKAFAARTWTKHRIRIVILTVLGIGIAAWKKKIRLPRCISSLPAAALVFYAVYLLGMVCVYIFSMRQREAVRLGGYFRYFKTMEIVIVGMGICYAANLSEWAALRNVRFRKLAPAIAALAMLAWLGCAVKDCESSFLLRRGIDPTDPRTRTELALSEYFACEEERKADIKTLLICHNDSEIDYYGDIAKYLTKAERAPETVSPDREEIAAMAKQADALLILDRTEGTDAYLRAIGRDPDNCTFLCLLPADGEG